MNIVVYLNGFYDWEPVPEEVTVTDADVIAKRVKPSSSGGWLMRVSKKQDTYTQIGLGEADICTLIIGDKVRDRVTLTRNQAVARYLARHVMPHHAHKNWMKSFEVSDNGPNLDLFKKIVNSHVEAGNIDLEDIEEM